MFQTNLQFLPISLPQIIEPMVRKELNTFKQFLRINYKNTFTALSLNLSQPRVECKQIRRLFKPNVLFLRKMFYLIFNFMLNLRLHNYFFHTCSLNRKFESSTFILRFAQHPQFCYKHYLHGIIYQDYYL
jgi:hypothetical protein